MIPNNIEDITYIAKKSTFSTSLGILGCILGVHIVHPYLILELLPFLAIGCFMFGATIGRIIDKKVFERNIEE